MTQLNVGDKAPDFEAKQVIGAYEKKFTASMQKTGVVLYFYPKDMTSGCTVQAKEFSALNEKFMSEGFKVFGISKDSIQSHKNFIAKENLKISLISDEDTKIAKLYGTWVEKSMYGRKYMGMSRDIFVISKDGFIIHILRNVKAKGNAMKVLQLCKAIS